MNADDMSADDQRKEARALWAAGLYPEAFDQAIDALDAMEALWNEHVEAGDCLKRIWALEAENAKLRAAGDAMEAVLGESYSGRDDPGATFLGRRTEAQVAWAVLRKEASDG